jgi:hypothetical protein
MNPDLYKDMIRNIQWLIEDKDFLSAYYDGKMSQEDADEIEEIYNAVQGSLDHLARKSRYQVDVYKRNQKRAKKIKLVKCIDNKGYEDNFEEGIVYILREDKGKTLVVEDMEAKDAEVLRERFETNIVEETA